MNTKDINNSNKKVADYFNDKEGASNHLPELSFNISEKDFEKLKTTNDFLYYSKAVFNNKNNRKLIQKIKWLELLKVTCVILFFISLIATFFVYSYTKTRIAFFLIPIIGFSFVLFSQIISYLCNPKAHSKNGKTDAQKEWKLSIKIKNKSSFIIKEYLKCKYESINNIKLSNKRIEFIKKNFNSYNFKTDLNDKKEYIEIAKRCISKKAKKDCLKNYEEVADKKGNKFLNFIEINYLLTFISFCLIFIFFIIASILIEFW